MMDNPSRVDRMQGMTTARTERIRGDRSPRRGLSRYGREIVDHARRQDARARRDLAALVRGAFARPEVDPQRIAERIYSSEGCAPAPGKDPCMPDLELVNVSRLQFALTAMYHFLFVPLTLGLSWMLVIMESVYVMTGREIYARHDAVLGHAVRHQLRHGRRPPASRWSSSSAPTGPTTRTMSATCSACRWPSRA